MNNNKATSTTSKLEELSELIEKMIRNPDGEAVYFGSLENPATTMDRQHGTKRYV